MTLGESWRLSVLATPKPRGSSLVFWDEVLQQLVRLENSNGVELILETQCVA